MLDIYEILKLGGDGVAVLAIVALVAVYRTLLKVYEDRVQEMKAVTSAVDALTAEAHRVQKEAERLERIGPGERR